MDVWVVEGSLGLDESVEPVELPGLRVVVVHSQVGNSGQVVNGTVVQSHVEEAGQVTVGRVHGGQEIVVVVHGGQVSGVAVVVVGISSGSSMASTTLSKRALFIFSVA